MSDVPQPTKNSTLAEIAAYVTSTWALSSALARKSVTIYYRAGKALLLARSHFPKHAESYDKGFDAWVERQGIAKTKGYEAMRFAKRVDEDGGPKRIEKMKTTDARRLYGVTRKAKPSKAAPAGRAEPVGRNPIAVVEDMLRMIDSLRMAALPEPVGDREKLASLLDQLATAVAACRMRASPTPRTAHVTVIDDPIMRLPTTGGFGALGT